MQEAISRITETTTSNKETALDVHLVLKIMQYRRLADGIQRVRWDPEEASVEKLLESLAEGNITPENIPQPKPVAVSGVLSPMALLSSGCFNISERKPLQKIIDRGNKNLRGWLEYGFQTWGPSLDMHWRVENENSEGYYIAQLGHNDESSSLPVVIEARKAQDLKLLQFFKQQGDKVGLEIGAVHATVKADLCHRSHAPDSIKKRFGDNLDYFLLLTMDQNEHTVIPNDKLKDEVYSAYLWICLAPKEIIANNAMPTPDEVYFVWEHSNILDKESVEYNLDSLAHKKDDITKKIN